ncbi:MAG: response regulator transcription factor [Dehalococcoidia bacterium]|nr:MAG: response regulator transcription factor [Dehalococcoidia bacterium]
MAKNEVYLDEDGILRIVCIGDQDENSASEMMEEAVRIANSASGQIKVLFDTTRAGKFSVEARQAAVESLALALHSKAAVVASSMPMRALGLFMVGGAKTPNMKVFETATEALDWLSDYADHEIARGLQQYSNNKEIAAALQVSEKTVKTHVSNILQKLHLSDRTQAALYAVRQRIANDDSE